ncbi:MAG: hypothetical protein AB7K64_06465 [Variibacter sp.]
MKAKTKIWVGVGAFVFAGGAAIGGAGAAPQTPTVERAQAIGNESLDTAQGRDTTSQIAIAQHLAANDHGGEGGEGGEEGGEHGFKTKLPPDLEFALSIGELRGHLLVGNELVQQGQWAAALPHFLHPTEEIYGKIRGQLKNYKTPPFEAALKSLAQTVKTKKGGEAYTKAFNAVEDALAKTDVGLKAKQPSDWDGFTAEAAVELIKAASGEYEEAIVKGRIAKPVEYQDARGFILQAEKMLDSVALSLEKKDADALKQTREALAELKKAFPEAMPPKAPVKDYGALLSDVSRLELAAGKLM